MSEVTAVVVTEQELLTEVSSVEVKANSMTITDETTYSAVAVFARQIKTAASKVEKFFEPIKSGAYNSWKAICNKENEFKKPLENAEKTIKNKMGVWQTKQDRIRRVKEAELRRAQQAEADLRATEAFELAQQGKAKEADKVFEQAVKIESARVFVAPAPKAEGVSMRTEYQISITDEKAVPSYVGGICIRPVDIGTIKKMAVTAKGSLDIPGILVTETKSPVIKGY